MRAKKFLGQNFLKSKEAINKIVSVSFIERNDYIIEIGPGKGALTAEILKECRLKNAKLIAIEKDFELINTLEEKFVDYLNKEFYLINDDILNIDIKKIVDNNIDNNTNDSITNTKSIQPATNSNVNSNKNISIKIIANIPYYITGAIIRKFVDDGELQSMTLLIQKEVAERIVCKDNKESILSLAIKSYGETKYIMKVEAKYFTPVPKVDSAIIYIKKYKDSIFIDKKEKELYFDLIKTGLQFKRKTLLNNLKELTKNYNLDIISIFTKLEIKENIRGEDLEFIKWIMLTREILNKK